MCNRLLFCFLREKKISLKRKSKITTVSLKILQYQQSALRSPVAIQARYQIELPLQ